MAGNLSRRLEVAANVAIIVVAVLVCFVVVKTYLPGGSARPQQQAQAPAIGSKISVPDVDWGTNGRTLVLVLQKGCHFCAESAPFYQRLVRDTAGREGLRLVAVLPQKVEEGRQYLTDLGVPIDEVRQASSNDLGVRGTPTLLLVDNSGAVTDSWVGKVPPDKEDEVLNRLKS
jgi:thiol-disulfide isomerase/thioredoxin